MDKITRDVRVQRYFPSVVAPSREFRALAEAENPEFKLIYDAAWKWFANTFVFNTDEDGVKRWESMLKIFPSADATLDDRRLELYLRCNYGLPYTERSFATMLSDFFGYGNVIPLVNPDSYELSMQISESMLTRINAIKRYTRLIVPANLSILIAQVARLQGDYFSSGVLRISVKRTLLYGEDYPITRYNTRTATWIQSAINAKYGSGIATVNIDDTTCWVHLTQQGASKAMEIREYVSNKVPQRQVIVNQSND